MAASPKEMVQQFADTCIRCGQCARTDCGNYAPGTPNLGDICESILSGDETWRHFAFTCALCDRCTIKCPKDLSTVDACKNMRSMILEKHEELRPLYRKFRTDLKYNLFSLLKSKAEGDIEKVTIIGGETDLSEEANATAFFPGCSLYAYAPELTAKVSDWLRSEEIAARTLYVCCGATFADSGFYKEAEAYQKELVGFLNKEGIKRLVITCPHCNYILMQTLEGSGIEILKLSKLLKEHGMESDLTGSISFHDSCFDRETSEFGEAARALYPNATELAMKHDRRNSMCCGGGGMVSVYAPAFCEYRRNMRLAEIDEVPADRIMSACFSCVNSLQRGIGTTPVQHYLEPIFDVEMDWPGVYASVDALFADPKTEELYAREDKTFE